jgi:hypothetical protein
MPIEILMPALSPTMEEGTLAKWLVKEGDTVSSGDVMAEIETDKATMEFEAVDEGIIGKIVIAEGTESVKVNAVIARRWRRCFGHRCRTCTKSGTGGTDCRVSGSGPSWGLRKSYRRTCCASQRRHPGFCHSVGTTHCG